MSTMPIATKTAAALFALLLTLIAGAWLVLQATMLPSFERLETELHARDRARVEANLQMTADDLLSRTLDYAHWDDTYLYVTGAKPDYIADNFTDGWFESYNVDLLAFTDEAGRVLWANGRDSAGAIRLDTAVVAALVREAREARANRDGLTGTVWTADGPIMFAAAQATTSDGSAAPRGLVIIARRLSAQALGEQIQLELQLVRRDASAELQANAGALATSGAITWETPDALHSLIGLRGARGEVAGAVEAHRPRMITALGARQITLTMLLLGGVAALAVAALWWLLRRLVLSRVTRLQRHIDAQTNHAVLTPMLAPPSRDEIGSLTDAYNAMALRLRDAMARERDAILRSEAANEAARMKSAFLANISYELRTPLNDVVGYAELVEEDLSDIGVSSVTSDLRRIRSSARRLISLTNEILDLSRIEAGRFEIAPASFRVEDVVKTAVDTMRPLAEQNGNIIEVDTTPGIGLAYSDENRLRQSLLNTLSIASKFTRKGVISITARRIPADGPDLLWFEITDTGAGMSEDQLARLFEPFIPGDVAMARDFGSAGLGLAITRKVLELMGGSFEAMSAPGRGSTFVLTLPAIANERPRAANDDKAAAAAA